MNLDDTLAVSKWGKPVSAQEGEKKSWWAALLEKSMAKFNVNYM